MDVAQGVPRPIFADTEKAGPFALAAGSVYRRTSPADFRRQRLLRKRHYAGEDQHALREREPAFSAGQPQRIRPNEVDTAELMPATAAESEGILYRVPSSRGKVERQRLRRERRQSAGKHVPHR